MRGPRRRDYLTRSRKNKVCTLVSRAAVKTSRVCADDLEELSGKALYLALAGYVASESFSHLLDYCTDGQGSPGDFYRPTRQQREPVSGLGVSEGG